jgi:hypothetical protein
METVILEVKSSGNWIQYPAQDGDLSLALMNFLLQQGVQSRAIVKINGHFDVFNINEMSEVLQAQSELVAVH